MPFSRNAVDALLALLLAVGAATAAWHANRLIDPVIYEGNTIDVWFEADTPRVVEDETSYGAHHYRTKVHPLLSLMSFLPVRILIVVLGVSPVEAVTIFDSVLAALWLATLFVVLRIMGCRRHEAVIFALAGATSAAAMFWFSVPETYALSSLTILVGLGLAAYSGRRKPSWVACTLVSAVTLSATVTNWMFGLLATFRALPRKQFLSATAAAFALVAALAIVQKVLFPTSGLFFLGSSEEANYAFVDNGGSWAVLRSMIFHTVVMPDIQAVGNRNNALWPTMSVQGSAIGSGSGWAPIATGLWIVLLALGAAGMVAAKEHRDLKLVLLLALLCQAVLHLIYGPLTFLYSLHFLPLLLLIAVFSIFSRWRVLAIIVAAGLAVSAAVNNGTQFLVAADHLKRHVTPRDEVLIQMRARPADPWPRGAGHVVLAIPGTVEEEKSYLEPGGSFSPAANTFGISLWIMDANGKRQATSDTIPLVDVHQEFSWSDGGRIPTVQTTTDLYGARWSSDGPGSWILKLTWQPGSKHEPRLLIRSPGPAGGPVRSLEWDGHSLIVNKQWAVTPGSGPVRWAIGDERLGFDNPRFESARSWTDERGWGFAMLVPPAERNWTVAIRNLGVPRPEIPEIRRIDRRVSAPLPDRRFQESMDAQLAHLMMGLVGRQTRPGDPMNYPLQWLRDGAYVVVALAGSGQLDLARRLSKPFAENDFFGGFGSEADYPGHAIWTLEQVAARVRDPEFDSSIWPHVRRKAEVIMECMNAVAPVEKDYSGPIVPRHAGRKDLRLVCAPPQGGLLNGRMDWRLRPMFVSAVSYRGLRDAAALATRLGNVADARRWQAAAAELRLSWDKRLNAFDQRAGLQEFLQLPGNALQALREGGREAAKDEVDRILKGDPERRDARTYISVLWPAGVAASNTQAFARRLAERWALQRDETGAFRTRPLWTYFDLDEAHQWLMLGDTERVWQTLDWFWKHQSSPGLYTWWEGAGEENRFNRWDLVRGWVTPPSVTPHYFTAAQMLLLQLDMLAYVDDSGALDTLVIGAGVPRQWLSEPLKIRGVSTKAGRVDWEWDGAQIQVRVFGKRLLVKPGSGFPSDTTLNVEFLTGGTRGPSGLQRVRLEGRVVLVDDAAHAADDVEVLSQVVARGVGDDGAGAVGHDAVGAVVARDVIDDVGALDRHDARPLVVADGVPQDVPADPDEDAVERVVVRGAAGDERALAQTDAHVAVADRDAVAHGGAVARHDPVEAVRGGVDALDGHTGGVRQHDRLDEAGDGAVAHGGAAERRVAQGGDARSGLGARDEKAVEVDGDEVVRDHETVASRRDEVVADDVGAR